MAKFSYSFRVLPVFYIMLYLDIIGQTNCQTATPCTGSEIYGRNNEGNTPDVDGRSGTTYILLGAFAGYEVDCCGVADIWRAEINPVGINETVYFQIWRPQGTGNYQLVGENAFLITATGLQQFTVVNKISIVPGDRIGWYTSGANMIQHKIKASADATFFTIPKPSQGDIINTGGSTIDNTIEYGITMLPVGDSIPAFTSPSDGSTFNLFNNDPFGSFVAKLVWFDADEGDNVTATMDTFSTKFAFNSSTGEITVASSLAGPTVTETLSFTITDACGNTATLTIDIVFTNLPPTLHGLSASGTFDEDSTGNVLIYTINATDPTDTVSCAFTAATLEAAYPFSVRLIPSSTDFGIYIDVSGSNYSTNRHYALKVVCSDGYADSNTDILYVYLPNIQTTVAGKRIDGEKIGFLTAICLLSAAFFLSVAYVAILKRRLSQITPVQTNKTNIRVSQYDPKTEKSNIPSNSNEASPSKSSGNNTTRTGVDTEIENVEEVKAQNSAPLGQVVGAGTAATSGPKSLRK